MDLGVGGLLEQVPVSATALNLVKGFGKVCCFCAPQVGSDLIPDLCVLWPQDGALWRDRTLVSQNFLWLKWNNGSRQSSGPISLFFCVWASSGPRMSTKFRARNHHTHSFLYLYIYSLYMIDFSQSTVYICKSVSICIRIRIHFCLLGITSITFIDFNSILLLRTTKYIHIAFLAGCPDHHLDFFLLFFFFFGVQNRLPLAPSTWWIRKVTRITPRPATPGWCGHVSCLFVVSHFSHLSHSVMDCIVTLKLSWLGEPCLSGLYDHSGVAFFVLFVFVLKCVCWVDSIPE